MFCFFPLHHLVSFPLICIIKFIYLGIKATQIWAHRFYTIYKSVEKSILYNLTETFEKRKQLHCSKSSIMKRRNILKKSFFFATFIDWSHSFLYTVFFSPKGKLSGNRTQYSQFDDSETCTSD